MTPLEPSLLDPWLHPLGRQLSIQYSAYMARTSGQRNVYAAAGAMTIGILPLTASVMMPGIHRLLTLAKSDGAVQAKAQDSGEVMRLLRAWTGQN